MRNKNTLYHRKLSRFSLVPLLFELRHLEITLWHKRGAGGQGGTIVEGEGFLFLSDTGAVTDFFIFLSDAGGNTDIFLFLGP